MSIAKLRNHPYGIIAHIFNKINIKEPIRLATNMCMGDYHFFLNYQMQAGGKKILESDESIEKNYKIKYNFDNNKYVFEVNESKNNNTITYSVFNNDELRLACLIIMYNMKEEFCYIDNISALDQCFSGMKYTKNGTLLLKFGLDFIEKHLSKIQKIKYIHLRDTSNKLCSSIGESINLDSFYMLIHGDTWYGKYDFVPFNVEGKKIDELKNIDYKKNQKIVKNTLVKDIDMYDIFLRAVIDANNKTQKELIPLKNVKKIIDKYQNKTIIRFCKDLCEQYDKVCAIFYYLYEPLMKKLKMTNLHGTSYWKQL